MRRLCYHKFVNLTIKLVIHYLASSLCFMIREIPVFPGSLPFPDTLVEPAENKAVNK